MQRIVRLSWAPPKPQPQFEQNYALICRTEPSMISTKVIKFQSSETRRRWFDHAIIREYPISVDATVYRPNGRYSMQIFVVEKFDM